MSEQPGSEREPIRYVGGASIDPTTHDGRLRPALGVGNYQTMRANRSHPELAEGHGWTYNHAPMLCYWRSRFYQEYLSNPVDEHIAPGQTLLVTSLDGRTWGQPEVVFPPYQPPPGTPMPEGYSGYMMHQRMGFYVAPDGRLLVLGFYGHAEDPFGKGGIGRVVREVYPDGRFGPIYFIRYSSHAQWHEGNTSYPLYTRSSDPGFVAACEALLANRLITLQWWDEDRGLDGFYSVKEAGSALSFYHRRDGKVVALWKRGLCAISDDEGQSFSRPVKAPTIVVDGAKMWGQRTPDGRYALVYNPTTHSEHRYPLAIITGEDGISFDNLLLVHGEVPPRRFYGRYKDFGPQYVRGIVEGNGTPPGQAMWVTYSMNKEDMWVSRIPVPVRYRWEGEVADDFDRLEVGGHVPDWNVYSPRWAPVGIVAGPGEGKSLELRDEDPYDYARAVRVFQEGIKAEISFLVRAEQADTGCLEIEVLDRFGYRPVRVRFGEDGRITAQDGARVVDLHAYRPGTWYRMQIEVDTAPVGHYRVSLNGRPVLKQALLAEGVCSVERLSFRTGPYRDYPTRQTENQEPHDPLPGADERVRAAVYHLREVRVTSTD